jgi:drug/metabolite transporter (DMT)-like permease
VKIPRDWQGTALILVSATGFGVMAIFAKIAYAAGANVPTTLFLRFLLASVLLWVGIGATRRSGLPRSGRVLGACIGLGAVGYAAQSLIFFTALRYISVSLAALLLYTYPPVVTLLATVVLRERLDRWKALALCTAGVGLLLVLGPGVGVASGSGVLLALGASAVFSVYIIVSRLALRHIRPLVASAIIIPSACASFGLYGELSSQLRFGLSGRAYAAITGMALISTVLAIVAFFAGLERVGASRAALLSTFEPVVTISLGAALLGDRLSATQILGGVCIAGAVLLLHGARGAPDPAGERDVSPAR